MKTFKRLKNGNVSIDGIEHKPYCIGELPNKFGFGEKELSNGEYEYGIGEWYKSNKEGLIYIEKK